MDESGKGVGIITDGVMAAKGLKAAPTVAGVKYKDRQDIAMIYGQKPRRSAGTSTTSMVKAAPVKWDKSQVTNRVPARTVVISAGIANACTGEEDMGYCEQTAGAAAQALGIPTESVLVASTGTINIQLSMDGVTVGVKATAPLLDESLESDTDASRAVMTTNTKNKGVAVQSELGGDTVVIGGMCKDSGTVRPNMYTTLSFMATDAAISEGLPQEILSQDVQDTYNTISVDGDTSANGAVLLLVNGLASNQEITEKNEDYHTSCRALKIVNKTLAREMMGDGGDYTVLFEAKIVRTGTKEWTRVLAKSVICSSFVKAAIFGHDASQGEVPYTVGYSEVWFDPERVNLHLESTAGKMQIIKDGMAVDYSEEQATRILLEPAVTAVAGIKMGDAKAIAWGCGLTFDYARTNAGYCPQHER